MKDKTNIKKKCIPLLKCSKKKEIKVFENAQKMWNKKLENYYWASTSDAGVSTSSSL